MTYFIRSSYTIFLFVAVIIRLIQMKLDKEKYMWSKLKRRYWKLFLACTMLSLIGITSALSWYVSLPLIPVSANTAIYNSQCVGVFIFSVLILKEKINLWKVLAILLCVGGVVMIALGGKQSKSATGNSAWGYLAVAISMVSYSLYEVLYKKWIEEEPNHEKLVEEEGLVTPETPLEEEEKGAFDNVVEAFLVIGFIGLITLFVFWIGIPIANATGLEKFEFPTSKDWEVLFINALLDTTFNVFLLISISFSNPLFVSIVSLLTIPTSVVADK